MSCTEIYVFKQDGNAELYGEVRNAWRGGMAVWHEMEARYLPPYIPNYVKICNWYHSGMDYSDIVLKLGYTPTRCAAPDFSGGDPMNDIWQLYGSDKVSEKDQIVLATTFDGCLVRKEDIPKVIDAFNSFGGETSLPEQAEILQKAFDDPEIIAVGWNQTSVNGDTWSNIGGYDEEEDEYLPYNCLTMKDHWWLFHEEEDQAKADEVRDGG